MSLLSQTKTRVSTSKHEVVFSHDPSVTKPAYAGWLPSSKCESCLGADTLTVRALSLNELADLRDIAGTKQFSNKAWLACARLVVSEVNGSKKPEDIETWIDAVFRQEALILWALHLYIFSISEGTSPESFNESIQKVFGELETEEENQENFRSSKRDMEEG